MLLSTAYNGSISYYSHVYRADNIVIDVHEHFIKQTHRSRCHIYGPNGPQILSVPVHRKNHMPIKEVKIDFSTKWQTEHLRSLKTAYASTPYYEDYIADVEYVLKNPPDKLLKLNLELFKIVCQAIGIQKETTESESFEPYSSEDLRTHPGVKNTFPEYFQPFSDRHGFIEDLSILDLLFNEGPETLHYIWDLK